MISVVIIGAGHVATHFHNAFLRHPNAKIVACYNRTPEKLNHVDNSIKIIPTLHDIPDADLILLAISDDAIAPVCQQLNKPDQLIVHCSGSRSISILGEKQRKGVIYPLQSFNKDRNVDWKNIPLLLEAEQEEDMLLLQKIGGAVSANVQEMDSKKRIGLHISATFVNNFTNHILTIVQHLSESFEFDPKLLKPLIEITKENFKTPIRTENTQTGAAIRRDENTLRTHIELLEKDRPQGYEDFINIYCAISQSIINHHHGRNKNT